MFYDNHVSYVKSSIFNLNIDVTRQEMKCGKLQEFLFISLKYENHWGESWK